MVDDDEQNPWRWMGTAQIGQPSEVLLQDTLGPLHIKSPVFLHDDGYWYIIEGARKLLQRPIAWRYATVSVATE